LANSDVSIAKWLTCARFGWVNASYIYGLTLVSAHMKRALGTLTTWDDFVKATDALDIAL